MRTQSSFPSLSFIRASLAHLSPFAFVPDQPLTEEQIVALGPEVSLVVSLTWSGLGAHILGQERKSLAATLKQKGNDAYQGRNFAIAAGFYTRAIAVSPQPEPVFYSNRAACYVSMEPPQHEKVVEDCDEALKLDSRYVKALNRRATALEALERYEDALRGACWSHDPLETK